MNHVVERTSVSKPWMVSIIVSFAALAACKTPQTKSGVEQDEVVETPTEPGPFEAAEEWVSTPEEQEGPVKELVSQWKDPRIERMHRSQEGYMVLLTEEGSEDAVLLTVTPGGVVTAGEVVRADYLWPSK